MSKVPKLFYQPGEQVKAMLGNEWYDATVVRSNKKTVLVRTLHSQTKFRKVPIKPDEAGQLLTAIEVQGLTRVEPYTVHDTKVVKLPHARVKRLTDEVPTKPESELPPATEEPTPASTPDPLAWIDKL